MTYCVGLKLKAGLVLLSDTRTNAGVDNIARFRKMFVFEEPGERVVALMCAGNLGVTQGVLTHVTAAVKRAKTDPEIESIMTCETLYRGAQMVGGAIFRPASVMSTTTLTSASFGAPNPRKPAESGLAAPSAATATMDQ